MVEWVKWVGISRQSLEFAKLSILINPIVPICPI